MSIRGSFRQMREEFEGQFEPSKDNRYLYRRNAKAAPIPVSADERQRFVDQYVKRLWLVFGGMMASLIVLVAAIVWYDSAVRQEELSSWPIYAGTVAIAVVAVGSMLWVRGAPGRELAGRTPVGRERSSAEVSKAHLRKLSYGQLAWVALVGVIVPFGSRASSNVNVFEGWGRLLLLAGAALIILAAVQAFRKWRLGGD